MNFFVNKRGMELAIGSVAIIAIILLVIIVVVGFFLGGFGRAGTGITQISQQGETGAAGLNLSYKCLGTPRMSNSDCKRPSAVGSDFCNDKAGTKDAQAISGKCADLEQDACEDSGKSRGCYWGFGQ